MNDRRETMYKSRSFESVLTPSSNKYLEVIMNGIIFANVGIMIVEADQTARCVGDIEQQVCVDASLVIANVCFLVIYSIEIAYMVYVHRWVYFNSKLNILDFLVVLMGIVTIVLEQSDLIGMIPNIQILRILRVARLSRAARLMATIPELSLICQGFVSAMSAMFWGLLMILIILIFFSILSVELLHPKSHELFSGDLSDPWCEVAFSSVWNSFVYYFQTLLAGDSWGACTRPLILEYWWTFIIFGVALVSVNIGFLNLILSVIVDSAAAARDREKARKARVTQDKEEAAIEVLHDVIRRCDLDESGEVTLEEFKQGFETNPDVADVFKVLDFGIDDLEEVFDLMDVDGSKSLTYEEFIGHLRKAEMQDPRIQNMLISLQVAKIRRTLAESAQVASRSEARVVAENHDKIDSKLDALAKDLAWLVNHMCDLHQKASHGLQSVARPFLQPSIKCEPLLFVGAEAEAHGEHRMSKNGCSLSTSAQSPRAGIHHIDVQLTDAPTVRSFTLNV